MKKLLAVIFALLPVLAFAASPNHKATSTQTKSVKTAVKKWKPRKQLRLKPYLKQQKESRCQKAERKNQLKLSETKKR